MNFLNYLVKNVANLIDDFFKFIDDIINGIKASVILSENTLTLQSMILPISDFFNAARWFAKEIWIVKLKKIGFTISKIEKDSYRFFHKGDEIFRGSKKAGKEFIEDVFNQSKNEKKSIEGFLDEIADAKRNGKLKLTTSQLVRAKKMWKEFKYQDLLKVGKPPAKKLPCFLAGTKVLTLQGLTNIEELSISDKVLTYNPKSGENDYNKIKYLHHNFTLKYVKIKTKNETLNATGAHLFYIPDTKKWIAASKLEVGIYLMNDQGIKIKVLQLTVVEEKVDTYNLEIENNHNYYVGKDQVLTHNAYTKSIFNQTTPVNIEFYRLIDGEKVDRYVGKTIQGTFKRASQHEYDYKKGGKPWMKNIDGHSKLRINGVRGPFSMTPYESAVVEMTEITTRGGKFKNPRYKNLKMKPLFNSQNPITNAKFNYFKNNFPGFNPCRFYV